MTAPRATVTGSARLRPSRDARLVPYFLIAVGGLAASLIAGEPALAALAIPFALALGLGLRRIRPVTVTARFVLDTDQVLEDDPVTGRLELEWDGAFEAQVMLDRLRGVAPLPDHALSWSLPPASRSFQTPIRMRAAQWGRHTPGEVWLRMEAPLGLLTWTGKVIAAPALRVLPGSERLTRLLDPAEPRTVLGAHRSKRIGGGDEFAELRPYSPGDRLRDLNWAATARHRRPFVNRHHPELAGVVVIAIDALTDGSAASTAVLARAARAAWALASVHLRANDRVGLAGLGGSTQWLPPAGGRLARYRLLETLLRVGGDAADPVTVRRHVHRTAVPSSALVIALTPLHDKRTVDTLLAWRARGRSVAVVVIETADLLGAPASPAEALARRVLRLELDRRRRQLAELSIPVVTATAEDPMTTIVPALRRARRAPFVRRRRR